jgi:hypothetical protein
MPRPVRLQLSRRKGFDLQAHSHAVNGLDAVSVARSTGLGNPWRVTKDFTKEQAWAWHANWLRMEASAERDFPELRDLRKYVLTRLSDLRGKNLACWCKLPEEGKQDICHAGVLLELANK